MYPQDWLQVLILVGAVVPGFAYQTSRRRVRGPDPDEQSVSIRVLRSIAMSFVFVSVYVVVFGYPLFGLEMTDQGVPSNWRATAVWVLSLVFVVPWIVARVVFYIGTAEWVEGRISWLSTRLSLRRGWDPTPTAWDFAFSNRRKGWIRVQTTEGVWMGGWYGSLSFASSYPNPQELYLECGYAMNDDGTFRGDVSASGGIYVRCDDIRLVDFTPADQESAIEATRFDSGANVLSDGMSSREEP